MRQTLLFGGLESIAHNANRKNADLKFFEFGIAITSMRTRRIRKKYWLPIRKTITWVCG